MDQSDSRFLRIRRDLGFWTKTAKIVFAGVLIAATVGVVFGEYGLLRIVEVRKERARLEDQIAYYTMRQKLLEERRWQLENDLFTLEKLAREKCGYSKPGEIIFLFQDEDSTQRADIERIPLDNFSLNR
jgi:cell division protein FtsB